MAAGIPRIKEFPSDDRYWRVDWFGSIERNPNVPSEPYVQIIISPFLHNDSIHTDAELLAKTNITDYDQQRTIRIGVGQLPFVAIGSIWLNGHCQAVKAGKTVTFDELLITENTTLTVPGGHKQAGANIIPYMTYRTGKGFMANLVAVNKQDDPFRILVPVMELIRFYYAVSTDMAHVVFSGDLKHAPSNVVNPERCGFIAEENRCVLHLRQHLTDQDGWVIGRILSCDEAWRGATLPHDSMMRDALNSRYSYPESVFPFSGTTDLKVRGIFFKATDTDSWRFLALEILHCSAPFPFEHLTAGRDNDAQSDGKDDDRGKKAAHSGARHKTSDGTNPLQSEEEPDQSKTNEHIPLPTDKFGSIAGKKVDRPPKEECRYMSALRYAAKNNEPTTLGTGQGNSKGSEAGRGYADQVRTRRKALPASFEAFTHAMELLDQTEGIKARIRPSEDGIEFIPLTQPAHKKQWSYLDSSTRCRRQVIIADISNQGRWYTLIEFELRDSEKFTVALVYSMSGGYLSDQQLNFLFLELANEKGVWSNINSEFMKLITLKHTWSSLDQFASSVEHKLRIIDNTAR